MSNTEIDLLEIIDLLSFTFSSEFILKWNYKYGNRLPRLFQLKLLNCLKGNKPLKLKSLFKFFVVDSGFNTEVVVKFLNDIDTDLYSPIISGRLSILETKNENI